MRIVQVAFLTAAFVGLPACRLDWSERMTGTMIGAGAGALASGLLGSAVGSTAGGAVLGAAAGGAAGYIIGDYIADKRERECGCEQAQEPAPAPAPLAQCEAARGGSGAARGGARAAARREYEAGRHSATADEAISHYEQAIRLDPSAPEPYNAKGLVLLYGNRKDEARRAFAQALSADPSYKPAEANLRRLGA